MLDAHRTQTYFDNLNRPQPHTPNKLAVRRVLESEIDSGLGLAAQFLKEAAIEAKAVKAVMRHNEDAFWAVFQDSGEDGTPINMVAVAGFLLLNQEGAACLLRQEFDTHKINLHYLSETGDRPKIVYVWGIIAKGMGTAAVGMINREMLQRYDGCEVFARAATPAGLRLMLGMGYRPYFPGQQGIGAIYRHHRPAPIRARETASIRRKDRYRVVPVATGVEFEQAMAIRTVFLTEQNCPYDEEFDGNDRCGTLFLGYVDGEPAATLRIRYFADFFKMERLAVLPRFRRTLVAKEVVLAAINFCRRKGYRKGFGYAQEQHVAFWAKFGFKPTARNCRLQFSDYEYLEMYGDLAPDERALTMASDPYVLIRPEGYWDQPGVLERGGAEPPAPSAAP